MTTTYTIKWIRSELERAEIKLNNFPKETGNLLVVVQSAWYVIRREWCFKQLLRLQLKEFNND